MKDQGTDAARRRWMSLLATAEAKTLAEMWSTLALAPEHHLLRPPEIGSVMVRGRAGASGGAFNLGEMTVTRCSVRLATGEEGHAYIQGRDKKKARRAALVDALMQTDAAEQVQAKVIEPLAQVRDAAKAARAAKAAATKVDFFTMARGED